MLLKDNEDTRKQRQRMSNSLSLFLGVGGFVSLAFRVPIRNYENLFAQEQKQSDKHNKEIQRRVECLFFFFSRPLLLQNPPPEQGGITVSITVEAVARRLWL
jgi:hypothetical protein